MFSSSRGARVLAGAHATKGRRLPPRGGRAAGRKPGEPAIASRGILRMSEGSSLMLG